jgi:hypothetical protein
MQGEPMRCPIIEQLNAVKATMHIFYNEIFFIYFAASGSRVRVIILISRVTGAGMMLVIGDTMGICMGTVLVMVGAFSSDARAARMVVIVSASFLETLSCSNLVRLF